MDTISLMPVRWMLIKGQDALHATARANFDGGYRHAASAQSIYFQDGSISAALVLADEISKLNKDYPCLGDIRPLADKVAGIYQYEENDDIWHFRNTSEGPGEKLVRTDAWRLFFYTDRVVLDLPVPATKLDSVLTMFSALSGSSDIEELTGNIHDDLCKILIKDLAAGGLLRVAPRMQTHIEYLPDLLFLGHSSLAVRGNESLIVIDPVVLPATELLAVESRNIWSLLIASDAILISHHHWDHLHFQTLVRLPRDKKMIVPKCVNPSFANPSIKHYLTLLGFSNILEVDPGQEMFIGDIYIKFFPFFGEPSGLNSRFNAYTYFLRFRGRTLYGSLDACHDEVGSMEHVIDEIAKLGALDYFLFGSSGKTHTTPVMAAGLRYFSNELKDHPELIRYHPNVADVERWSAHLRPRCLVPYAEFIFSGHSAPDLDYSKLEASSRLSLESAKDSLQREVHREWLLSLRNMAERLNIPLLFLQPTQGIT